ncbi:TfuA-like protein [Rhizobium sp. FY34]|uniref:TfuA-like protein n=1 Tax=Rhizobium sp. FY34 TaxID=2562309 RepID=UPI0010C118BE|nr:TfuA-like protein [Rhizobium sp. FY34]
MKVVFVGPSLPDAASHAAPGVDVRPPARQGDLMEAFAGGAKVVGLIDGYFEMVAPVWHKEILYLLSQGVAVIGASSMGALRAAECAPFGMIGIGRIFEDYASGIRVDDADVALQHGPAELGYPPLTVPFVNVEATLGKALSLGLLSADECHALQSVAGQMFYKTRSWKSLSIQAGFDWPRIRSMLALAGVDQKKQDALQLLDAMTKLPDKQDLPGDWTFNATPLWRKLYPNTA